MGGRNRTGVLKILLEKTLQEFPLVTEHLNDSVGRRVALTFVQGGSEGMSIVGIDDLVLQRVVQQIEQKLVPCGNSGAGTESGAGEKDTFAGQAALDEIGGDRDRR